MVHINHGAKTYYEQTYAELHVVLMYGVPLRRDDGGQRVYEARVTDVASPDNQFQIPAGYKKVPPPR